jgi:hypothetical protein
MGICGMAQRLAHATVVVCALVCIGAPLASADGGDRGGGDRGGERGGERGGDRKPPSATPCVGVRTGIVPGSLLVKTGTTCNLVNAKVLGSVTVEPAAALTGTNSVIAVDLTCTGATCTLTSSRIGHDVAAKNGSAFSSDHTTVDHDVTCANQHCTLTYTTVGGEVEMLPGNGVLDVYASRMEKLDCFAQAPESGCNVYFDVVTQTTRSVITGTVYAGPGAALSTAFADIGEHVICDRCATLEINDTTIGGNATVDGGDVVHFCNDAIAGNLRISSNRTYFSTCGGSQIGGNVQLLFNRGNLALFANQIGQSLILVGNRADEIALVGNQVRQSISCENSRPQPIGYGNTAKRIDRECGPIGAPAPPPPGL